MLPLLDSLCTFAIIKHGSPCGAALGDTIYEAYVRAWSADAKSPYGSIFVCNRMLNTNMANHLSKCYIDVLTTPDYEPEALSTMLSNKHRITLIKRKSSSTALGDQSLLVHSALGSLLMQTPDPIIADWPLLMGGHQGLSHQVAAVS
jgi:phosphoribosylaminoimidazolecarboxamide formyltransferase/IMP cyclohydrolase